ncbi:MAG: chemotaxis protein CheW [Spongiibacteraceae bacterium]
MSNSNDFLQDYLDSLLNDNAVDSANRAAGEQSHVDEGTLKLASGSNIAPLPSAPRPARVVPARPYAEPVRTLNLRMPLPPVAEAVAPAVEANVPVKTAPAVEVKSAVESKPVVESRPALEAKLAVELTPPVEVETSVEPKSEPTAPAHSSTDLSTMAPPAAWLSNGRPQWAQQPFECLIFKAGGLQLAAPLVELGSIYPLEEDALTEIFGQTEWFMGLLPIKEYNVRTMDTGLVVMPERYNAAMREQYRYVVSLFGSDWGLAVDAVVGTTLLDPDRVRWRGERSKRPWLAGTLIDQMCALFDISQLAWLFHNQDRKRSKR